MKKTLYKPETDDLDVNVVAYANEAWFNIRACSKTKNSSGCKPESDKPKKGIDIFFCKRSEGKLNQVCPID